MTDSEFPLRLQLGRVTLQIDERGRLQDVYLDNTEVVREVAGVVRDTRWGTVPGDVTFFRNEVTRSAIDIGFVSRHAAGDLDFTWEGRIRTVGDGALKYELSGVAESTFKTNRIGITVLHPLSWAGRLCTARHPDGTETSGTFPERVSPWQPFLQIVGLRQTLDSGEILGLDFEGCVFETEDQRNWSDASFKTYGPPLSDPYPITMHRGDRLRQRVTVSLRNTANRRPICRRASRPVPPVRVTADLTKRAPVPRLGWGYPPGERSRLLEPIVAAVRPGHLRVDVAPSGGSEVRGAQDLLDADRLGVPLEIAVHVNPSETLSMRNLAAQVAHLRIAPAALLVFDVGSPTTSVAAVEAVLRAFPSLPAATALGVGTDDYLAELLRNPVQPVDLGAEFVSFSVNPQVHDTATLSILRTVEALPAMVESARAASGDAQVGVSPMTFRPRRNIYGERARIDRVGRDEDAFDTRQSNNVGAAWLVASYKALARAGVARLTVAELSGPGGLAAVRGSPEIEPYPIFDVAACIGKGVAQADCVSTSPGEVEGLTLFTDGGVVTILANLGGASQTVRLDGFAACVEVDLGPQDVSVHWLANSIDRSSSNE